MAENSGQYPVTVNLEKNLRQAHFHLRTGDQLNWPPIRFVASKTLFFMPFMLMSTHIVVIEKDQAKCNDERELFNIGYRFAKKINWVPLLRGMQFGYTIMPLIVGRNPDSELLLRAASPPQMRFALIEYPIVIDLTGNQVAFFEGWVKLGGLFWPRLQDLVTRHIEPVIDIDDSPVKNSTT